MTRESLAQLLEDEYARFASLLEGLGEEAYCAAPEGKWTPGQHLDHLLRSTTPLLLALRLPRWALLLLFGRARRPSRSYEAQTAYYLQKLAGGGRASGIYVPPLQPYARKGAALARLARNARQLARLARRASEQDLDAYVLPHPLMGKLTLREMLCFTAYHARHHETLLRAYPRIATSSR